MSFLFIIKIFSKLYMFGRNFKRIFVRFCYEHLTYWATNEIEIKDFFNFNLLGLGFTDLDQ